MRASNLLLCCPMGAVKELQNIHKNLASCRACPNMKGTPVHGKAFAAEILLVGQAPGPHEADLGKPFAYTAGKTLFKWLGSVTQLNEEELRQKIYFSATARCFPGKNPKGAGDREPTFDEIEKCRPHLKAEVLALKPKLIIAVGRLAISEVLGRELFPKSATLATVVGKKFRTKYFGQEVLVIPLPHPSGVSRWTQTEPGKSKLREALSLIEL